jgi:hypothetical protein
VLASALYALVVAALMPRRPNPLDIAVRADEALHSA